MKNNVKSEMKKLHYPHSEEYEYFTQIKILDLDAECKKDLESDNGFIVGPYEGSIKKELKNINGIYSPKFGQTISDTNTYINKYKCKCGELTHRINRGLRCPKCGTLVKQVDTNFEYFGWFKLKYYHIIHPAFYKRLEELFGKKGISVKGQQRTVLQNILDNDDKNDINGNIMDRDIIEDEPYFGIGLIRFYDMFDEVLEHYSKKATTDNKKEIYNNLLENRDKIFIQSIPLFTTLLRPVNVIGDKLHYEKTNGFYSTIHTIVTRLNKPKSKMNINIKIKGKQLFKLQSAFMDLYEELEGCLSSKKGDIRNLIAARYNFSSRNVIVQNPKLRIDEITLPYKGLVIMLEQVIKNILHKMYNMSYDEADKIWNKSIVKPNDMIKGILTSIINNYKNKGIHGIPFIINRNPTIMRGSELQMFCVDFTMDYVMGVPLQPLELMVADFDGDVLNILLLLNKVFYSKAFDIFNPRNAFYISNNDGYFNTSVCIKKDTLINTNSMIQLGRKFYTSEDINKINQILENNRRLVYT